MEFFPPNALADSPVRHAFRESWYVSLLLAMQERPLHPPAIDQPDAYRLLFLPTFDHPAVIRLSGAGGAWRVVCKRSDDDGGYDPGQLASEVEREMSPAEAKQFGSALDRAAFWDMPSSVRSVGVDGSQAVLEGVRAGRYHVVDRWTPYAQLVEFLLELCRG